MDIKESEIIFDTKTGMYKLNIGFYSRYFDFMIYNNHSICKHLGNEIININNFKTDKNFVFGFTNFENKIIFNIFDLDNFDSIYRIAQNVFLTSFVIKGENYYLLIYEDLGGKISYYSNLQDEMFNIFIEDGFVKVKNIIFNSIVFEKQINFPSKINTISSQGTNNDKLVDILDFYYFDDLFTKNDFNGIYEDLKKIDNLVIKKGSSKLVLGIKFLESRKVPRFVINLKTNDSQIDLNIFKKLLLTINPNSYLFYSIDNQDIINQLKEFEDITNFQIKSFDLNFQIPDNIFEFDNNFINFQKNISKLRFSLYNLKINLSFLENNIIPTYNENLYLTQNRLDINSYNIKENITHFESLFSNLLEIIKKNTF